MNGIPRHPEVRDPARICLSAYISALVNRSRTFLGFIANQATSVSRFIGDIEKTEVRLTNAMEAYVVSARIPQLSLKLYSALLSVDSSLMTCQYSALQILKLTSRCRIKSTENRFCKCTGAGIRRGIDSAGQQEPVVFKSIKIYDSSVRDFRLHGHNRILVIGRPQNTMRDCSREFGPSRSVVTYSFTSAAVLYDLNADVLHRNEHFQRLENFHDDNGFFFPEESWDVDAEQGSSLSKDYLHNLIAAAHVDDGSTVLSWGGSSALIRQLYLICPGSIVVSHCSLSLLAVVKESYDDIVCWHGDLVDISSSSYGPFDSVFLNSLPALSVSPVQLLQVVAGWCKPGARIVISNSQGKKSLAAHRKNNPGVVLHDLPDLASLEEIIAGLPLKVVEFHDDSSYFLAALEVTGQAPLVSNVKGSAGSSSAGTSEMWSNKTLKLVQNYPLRVTGHVVKGFGRGSKQMGIPTANVDPENVPEDVLRLPKGVYCGWAQVHGEDLDKGVHKMVMNIGNRPTFADGGGISVEVHILHDYGDVDFYGVKLSFLVVGFIREEMQFKSPGELVQRISTDIEIARKGLDEEDIKQFATDEVFLSK